MATAKELTTQCDTDSFPVHSVFLHHAGTACIKLNIDHFIAILRSRVLKTLSGVLLIITEFGYFFQMRL